MSRSLISSGSESESSSERQRRTQDKGTANSQRATFPSAEECLSRLTQLAGLVALGLMTPARANSIRANYREILQYHRQSQIRAEGAGLADADILEILRKDPSMLNMLAPLLTAEQLAMVMEADAAEDGDNEAT